MRRLSSQTTATTPGLPTIRTDEDLAAFLLQRFGVVLPNTRVCPGHSTPFRAFADAYFARHPVIVWKGSRGLAGKTFTLALLAATEAITLKADVNVLGGSGEQSALALESLDKLWNEPNAPREFLASEPGRRVTRFIWANKIRALQASQRSVRGPHPQRLRLDEVDELPLKIWKSAMGQPMARGGIQTSTVISSTHQNADGTMTEVLKQAAEKGWPVHEWCLQETRQPHGWLSDAAIERKRAEMTSDSWTIEVELGEPSAEGRAFITENIDAMFVERLGVFAGDDNQTIEIEAPEPGARYATGGDWAKDVDWTIIWTWRTDVTPMRLVAFLRIGRRPWPQMVAKFDERVQRYPGPACHDTTGVGDVVDDYITVPAEGMKMVGRARQDLFTDYIAAVERGEFEAPKIAFAYSQHKFCRTGDLYRGGDSYHAPDTIVGGAMAYKAFKSGRAPGDLGIS